MVNLNNCDRGDLLISCHGAILEYVEPTEEGNIYDHYVKYLYDIGGNPYPNNCNGTRMNDGFVFINESARLPTDHNIVNIIKLDNDGKTNIIHNNR